MSNSDLIVIGASAGGVEALRSLLALLPRQLPAAIVAVIHTAPTSRLLPTVLSRTCPLPVMQTHDHARIRRGHVYIAAPDRQTWIHDGILRVEKGPRENGHRPAIDPLFRSAAQAYSKRVIGVILTGMQSDGAIGLSWIKKAGGKAIVQDPEEAPYPDMPLAAADSTSIDAILPIEAMAAWLIAQTSTRVAQRSSGPIPAPRPNRKAANLAGAPPPVPSKFTCPECHGTLWTVNEPSTDRFVCRVGHSYSFSDLDLAKSNELETALWVSMRTMQERADLQRRLAAEARERSQFKVAQQFEQRATELKKHTDVLSGLLHVSKDAPGRIRPAAEKPSTSHTRAA
jgi:two-component system chemotaxis response regulator CheB